MIHFETPLGWMYRQKLNLSECVYFWYRRCYNCINISQLNELWNVPRTIMLHYTTVFRGFTTPIVDGQNSEVLMCLFVMWLCVKSNRSDVKRYSLSQYIGLNNKPQRLSICIFFQFPGSIKAVPCELWVTSWFLHSPACQRRQSYVIKVAYVHSPTSS